MEIFKALSAGKEISNPAVWKDRQVTTNLAYLIIVFAVSALRMFGIELPDDDGILKGAAELVSGLLGFANIVLIYVTSKKVGIFKGGGE